MASLALPLCPELSLGTRPLVSHPGRSLLPCLLLGRLQNEARDPQDAGGSCLPLPALCKGKELVLTEGSRAHAEEASGERTVGAETEKMTNATQVKLRLCPSSDRKGKAPVSPSSKPRGLLSQLKGMQWHGTPAITHHSHKLDGLTAGSQARPCRSACQHVRGESPCSRGAMSSAPVSQPYLPAQTASHASVPAQAGPERAVGSPR